MNEETHVKRTVFLPGIILVLTAAVLCLTGCSKITTENYDRLEAGMTYDAVVELFGQADSCSGAIGLKQCQWGDAERHIQVNFAGNKVVLFSAKGL